VRSPYALLRLAARPTVVLGLLWASGLLFMMAVGSMTSPSSALTPAAGPWPQDVWIAYWRVTIGCTFALGMGMAFVALDLMKGLHAWTLPHLHGRVVSGFVTAGLCVALPLAALAVVGGRYDGAGAALPMAAATFLTAAASFAAGAGVTRLPDRRTLNGPAFLLLLAGLVALWRRADLVAATMRDQPVVGAVLAAVILAITVQLAFTPDSTRRTAGWMEHLLEEDEVSSRPWLSQRQWLRRPSRHQPVDWVRAAEYELFGGFRGGFIGQVTGWVLIYWIFDAFLGFEDGVSFGVVMAIFMSCHMLPFTLRRSTLYPTSRTRRATITFWSGFATLWIAIPTSVAAAVVITSLAHLLRPEQVVWLPRLGAPVACAVAWIPVLLYSSVRFSPQPWQFRDRGNNTMPSGMTYFVRSMATFVVFGGVAMVTAFVVDRLPTAGTRTGAILMVAVGVQGLYYVALRRFFRAHDLA